VSGAPEPLQISVKLTQYVPIANSNEFYADMEFDAGVTSHPHIVVRPSGTIEIGDQAPCQINITFSLSPQNNIGTNNSIAFGWKTSYILSEYGNTFAAESSSNSDGRFKITSQGPTAISLTYDRSLPGSAMDHFRFPLTVVYNGTPPSEYILDPIMHNTGGQPLSR
jgi:hypothetical protein